MTIAVLANSNDIHAQRWVKWFAQRDYALLFIDYAISANNQNLLESYGKITCREIGQLSNIPVIRDIQVRKRLLRILSDTPCHSLTCHSGAMGFRPALAGIRPLIVVAYGSDFFMLPYRSPIWKILYRFIASRTDYILCDSQQMMDEISKYGFTDNQKILYHLGVDTQLFDYRLDRNKWRKKLRIPLNAPVIYHTRILTEDYRVHRLLEAMTIVWTKRPDAICVLKDYHSNRKYKDRLDDFISRHGMSERVRYVPTVSYEELPYVFSMSDIAISLRVPDSAPISILEAIAMKKPVVASKLPNIEEWIKDQETGFLVDVDNPQEIAQAIIHLLSNPGEIRRISEEAYNRNFDLISMDVTMGKIESLYHLSFGG